MGKTHEFKMNLTKHVHAIKPALYQTKEGLKHIDTGESAASFNCRCWQGMYVPRPTRV
ncbi:hypothetical protein KP509_22G042800 [Ceratopteris richardii]|uniref:Uncharacterized protein n=1 Tax=Ceratopteris richardii TaxID=49495 RepID=A0A8T2S4D0_CERRI|nr:hypothetical protein KP509_22G042800 [Ceratopteris richardii]